VFKAGGNRACGTLDALLDLLSLEVAVLLEQSCPEPDEGCAGHERDRQEQRQQVGAAETSCRDACAPG
jgi:hypothetical protein